MMEDPILDAVHRASERLIEQCGGVDGLFKHLRAMDRERAHKAKRRTVKKLGSNGRKGRTRPARSQTSRVIKST